MKQDKNVHPSGVSRRTVVKGAAWAVPAITVASAVPAYASSAPIEITGVSISCKHPGNAGTFEKAYHIEFTFKNTSDEAVTFTLPGLVSIAGSPASSQQSCVPTSGDPTAGAPLYVTVPAGTTQVWVVHYYSNNSANGDIIFTYSYASALGTYTGTLPFKFALSGDPCQPKGISNSHDCSLTSDPLCVVSPEGPCPTP